MVLAAVQLLWSGPLMPTTGATKHLKERDGHSTGPPHTPTECRRIPLTFPLIIRLAGSQTYLSSTMYCLWNSRQERQLLIDRGCLGLTYGTHSLIHTLAFTRITNLPRVLSQTTLQMKELGFREKKSLF